VTGDATVTVAFVTVAGAATVTVVTVATVTVTVAVTIITVAGRKFNQPTPATHVDNLCQVTVTGIHHHASPARHQAQQVMELADDLRGVGVDVGVVEFQVA